jgi:hypothetical protein
VGIERARVVEVHAPGSPTGAGYLLSDRLVLTRAWPGAAEVRPGSTGRWLAASVAWSGAGAAVLEVGEPLFQSPGPVRWGRVEGSRPVPVTAMGFPPAADRPRWVREPVQLVGRLSPGGVLSGATVGGGMSGAALFAGAELVGVLAAGAAVPVARLAEDEAFVGVVGGLTLTPVSAPASGFSILG